MESEAGEASPREPAPAAEPEPGAARPQLTRTTIRRRRRRRVKRSAAVAVLARALDTAPGRSGGDPMRLVTRAFELKSAPGATTHGPRTESEPAAPDNDKQKVAEARAATDAAFWPIWLSHRDYLFRYSLRFSSGNAADAEDAMGEAMLKAVQAFSEAEIHNHRAWLLRLVHNACVDRYRVKERQNRLTSDITDDDGQSVPAIVPKPNRSPEELLGALQLITGLQEAMMTLPRSLAEPLLLYLDDFSDADIAASLNVTREVVRKRRQMARDWLRRKLMLP